MGLKSFHIFFVAVVTAFFGFYAVWALGVWRSGEGVQYAAAGAGSILLGVAAIAYSGWFLRKNKDVGFM